MFCPICGQEMTEGYIQSDHDFYFTKILHNQFFHPVESKGDIDLSDNNVLDGSKCKVHQCKNCRKIVIDY